MSEQQKRRRRESGGKREPGSAGGKRSGCARKEKERTGGLYPQRKRGIVFVRGSDGTFFVKGYAGGAEALP